MVTMMMMLRMIMMTMHCSFKQYRPILGFIMLFIRQKTEYFLLRWVIYTVYLSSLASARASCKDHFSAGHSSSGLYYINIRGTSFRVSNLSQFSHLLKF